MKHIFAVVVVFLITINLPMPGTSVQAQTSTTPEATVRAFYAWYLHAVNQNEDPLQKNQAELSKYITRRLMRSLNRALKRDTGINADFFIDAQDSDEGWEKNISVSKARIQGMRATVIVTLKGGTMLADNKTFDKKLKVGLRKEGGVWKIDTVNGKANVT